MGRSSRLSERNDWIALLKPIRSSGSANFTARAISTMAGNWEKLLTELDAGDGRLNFVRFAVRAPQQVFWAHHKSCKRRKKFCTSAAPDSSGGASERLNMIKASRSQVSSLHRLTNTRECKETWALDRDKWISPGLTDPWFKGFTWTTW